MLAAERLHGDDTTVPVLAKGKTITGRLWAYVRDDRPFGRGPAGGAVPLFARPPRRAPRAHLAGYAGILQADAYGGFGGLYVPTRAGGPSPRRSAGHMGGEASSSSPTSAEAGRVHRLRWHSRRSAGSTRSSPMSARSTAIPPTSGSPTAASIRLPWSATSRPG